MPLRLFPLAALLGILVGPVTLVAPFESSLSGGGKSLGNVAVLPLLAWISNLRQGLIVLLLDSLGAATILCACGVCGVRPPWLWA